jgi:adenylate kinase
MKKQVVILYGPPGSGKGTQANLVEKKLDLIHFDTGRFLEATVHDPARQKEAFIKRERKMFDNGMLLTPSFVLKEVTKESQRIARAGWGVVFSGSPRTMYEAERLMPVLEKLYGRKNIFIFELKLPPEHSVSRNSARLMCTICGYGLLTAYYPKTTPKHCPVCGGPFYRRTLDKSSVIKIRLEQYKNRTLPIIDFVKKRGYKVRTIDARPAPYKVFRKIERYVG